MLTSSCFTIEDLDISSRQLELDFTRKKQLRKVEVVTRHISKHVTLEFAEHSWDYWEREREESVPATVSSAG